MLRLLVKFGYYDSYEDMDAIRSSLTMLLGKNYGFVAKAIALGWYRNAISLGVSLRANLLALKMSWMRLNSVYKIVYVVSRSRLCGNQLRGM